MLDVYVGYGEEDVEAEPKELFSSVLAVIGSFVCTVVETILLVDIVELVELAVRSVDVSGWVVGEFPVMG